MGEGNRPARDQALGTDLLGRTHRRRHIASRSAARSDIRAFHAAQDETLHPVLALRPDGDGWAAELPGTSVLRESMSCTRFQGRQALRAAGLLERVDQLMVESDDEVLRGAWLDAAVWRRNSPFIDQMGAALDLTPAAIDDLFAAATTITA